MSFLFDLKLQFWHGDWFAAKGIGVCQIDYQGFDIHLYISHYHANYHPNHDIYLSHRVSHAFESAQWIKLASSAAGRLIDLISLRISAYRADRPAIRRAEASVFPSFFSQLKS